MRDCRQEGSGVLKKTLIRVLSRSNSCSAVNERYWSERSLPKTPKFQGLLESSSSPVSDRYSYGPDTGREFISGSLSHHRAAVAMWWCQVITSKIWRLKKNHWWQNSCCVARCQDELTVSCPLLTLSTQVRTWWTCEIHVSYFHTLKYVLFTGQGEMIEFLDT